MRAIMSPAYVNLVISVFLANEYSGGYCSDIKEVFQLLSMGPGYEGVVNITEPGEQLMGYPVVCYLCRVVPVYPIQQCLITGDCNLNFFLH